jgi:N-acetylglutamate synthase-like GNAT family acetyltransferase
MLIRPYTIADKEDCMTAFKSNMPQFFAPYELPDFENWLQRQETPKTTTEQYYVVEQNNTVIACGGYFIDMDKQNARMTWGLVHNSLHKQGIGKALFLHRVAVIKSVCSSCVIGLDTTQHSFPFFEKLGFNTIRITKDGYGPGLDRYDMEFHPA